MKNDDALDYKYDSKSIVSEKYFTINNWIGIALNIILPTILLFGFKISFTNYLLAFIAFDIFLVVLNYLSLKFYQFIRNIVWQTKKTSYEKKISKLSLSEMEDLRENISSFNKFYDFSKQKLNIINKCIDEYKSFDSITTPEIHKNDIMYVEEIIEKFKNYEKIPWIKKSLGNIVKKSEKLLDMIKEDPDSVSVISSTFNVYAEELMKIVVQYEDMDDEQKEKYKPKIKKLIEVFCSHLDDLELKIQSFKEHSIDRDIDFLMKKLDDNKEGDENVSK